MKKVLLIADDEEMNRRIIGKFLRDAYEIREASNGREALETLRGGDVDALLLDILMPEMDGLEVLRHLRTDEELRHVGVLVAISTKERTERAALTLGADDVVAKPYDPLVIRKRLENILAFKEIGRQRELLKNNSFEELREDRFSSLQKQAADCVEKIDKYLKLLNASKENFALVQEMTQAISAEAHSFVRLTQEEK